MAVESKRRPAPPLPAPTETNSTVLSGAQSDLAPSDPGTDASKPGDEKSTYSLPDDGTPVTIRTRHRQSRSQTSLLIEYFEGGRGSTTSVASEHRKPSVRVRVRPSSKHRSKSGGERDRIKITHTKSRKSSPSRRSGPTRSEVEGLSTLTGDMEDASSYASATEESTVSRNPIDIEIDRGSNVRRRRPASPLIPAADSKASYHAPTMSEISAIPADSFLDGSGPATSFGMSEAKSTRSRSPSRTGDYLAGAAAGLSVAAAADKLRNKSREDRERDRVVSSRSRDKDGERKHRSGKSRTSSVSKDEKYAERAKSPRRRSKGHSDSLVSGADSTVLSSAVAPGHRSVDQQSVRSGTSKASSINNPKLLETVEDAIRRLILPELNALKREQSRRGARRDSTTSSTTTASRDEFASDRRRSGAADKHAASQRDSIRSKESRDREARNDFDDSSALSHDSVEDDHDLDNTPGRSTDRLRSAAVAGAAVGAAAIAAHEVLQSPSDDKQRSRRRRRAEMRTRGSDHALDDGESDLGPPVPPMPLMSDVNASDVTRASIQSAETDRPHSASEELAPGRGLGHDQPSPASTPTPTGTPVNLQALGTQHANVSHGDLKTLPQQRTGQWDEYVIDDNGRKVPSRAARRYRGGEEEEEEEGYDGPGSTPAYAPDSPYDYYSTQDVPPPLKYVPYQPERRGLSPIPSVSGYTEGGSEAPNRESRASHRTADSVSSTGGSPRQGGTRGVTDDGRSVRSSGINQDNVTSLAGSELDRVAPGEAVRAVGLNPDFVHPPGIESNVASLVDGSMLDGSALTGSSSAVGNHAYNGRASMAILDEEIARESGTPTKRSVASQRDYADDRASTPASGSSRSREFVEYDLDEYGRKVPRTTYRQSPTVSEAAITSAAVGAAAAVLRAQHAKGQQQVISDDEAEFQGEGVQRNKSFKERTENGPRPGIDTASAEQLVNSDEKPKLGFNSMPDPNDPMPDGDWNDDDLLTNPSLLNGKGGREEEEEEEEEERDRWAENATPRQQPQQPAGEVEYQDLDGAHASPALPQQRSGHDLGMAAAAAAAGAASGMAAAQNHSRQPSQEHDEWYRTSEDKKRDTLVTNPYEGSSPVANIPGLNNTLLPGFDNSGFGDLYGTRSPVGHKVDEGYISQGPNKTPDFQGAKGKGMDFNTAPGAGGLGAADPFYSTPGHARHFSGMSQGMGSPMYDAATGTGIERIESKDIIALMQHLMVRDAQRSARDTEILVTLVRAATEMRNNFEDLKRLLADTEDVIITEVKENTEKTVQRAINGPRPYPGSAPRSIQGGSQAGTINGDDINTKRRSIFRRALKGLTAKGANDLSRIEDMLMQLLSEVDVLKAQTAPAHGSQSNHGEPSYDHMEPEVQSEQDHGYEPEGMAGTSTASHASQSGYLSIQSRGTSAKPGNDRKVSAHRISTVPEANEEDYDHGRRNDDRRLMTPTQEQRGNAMPLATPPGAAAQAQHSQSNENTPQTEESGKKKARSSWFRIPRISRWSETTASSGAAESRHSKQSSKDESAHFPTGQSRSGSLDHYQDNYQFSPPQGFQSDKLHTGFSETDLPHGYHEDHGEQTYGQMPPPSQPEPNWVSMNMTPEDPQVKAHRDSLNLMHPQPRQGQTERFKAVLESQALGYDSPLSPRSADWAGSATSLHRFGQAQHQHNDSYGSSADEQHYHQSHQHWASSPSAAANMTATSSGVPPPRPPKEALDAATNNNNGHHPPPSPGLTRSAAATPPQNKRISKLQRNNGSPLPHHSVESGYGTMTHGVPTASYISSREGAGSPRLENRNLSVAQAGVSRRPSGPRPMTPSGSGALRVREASGLAMELGMEDDRRRG
ncbi:uncharacterized protein P884DRAFT_199009 [Thermothelomyces heterothallicus CBS 202.75]|uniref:uncharacterized protein n=1 Tax=Thermothelomyces heterothallicus CBS 202.75 TaxID=1149848 RepID=UPI0037433E80